MIKTGAVTLTPEELEQAKRGSLPSRLSQSWDLTLEELRSIISSGNYQLIDRDSSDTSDNFESNF